MPERSDRTWPVYFARCDMVPGPGKVILRAGDMFPIQDKAYIRGIGASFGCGDAWGRSFGDLPYVAILDVQSEGAARHVAERGLTLEQARQLLGIDMPTSPPSVEAVAPAPSLPRRRGRPPKVREAAGMGSAA